jgi:hypothetical protein
VGFDAAFRLMDVLGHAPGLGIAFDEEKLATLAVASPSRTAGPSPLGRRRGAGLYDVPLGEPDDAGQE